MNQTEVLIIFADFFFYFLVFPLLTDNCLGRLWTYGPQILYGSGTDTFR